MLRYLSVFALFLVFTWSCSESTSSDENKDIPADPDITLPQVVSNNLKPQASFDKVSGNSDRIKISVLGMLKKDGTPFIPSNSTNSDNLNFFISEDGVVKGAISEVANTSQQLPVDIVFTVDNSGSMGQEADSIALGILDFANFLEDRGLDVNYGCVGYAGGVNGGMNFSTVEDLNYFLTSRTFYSSGTSRTYGFTGEDSLDLVMASSNYYTGGENGIVGIFFALDHFDWRDNALKVFYNFTDEGTQPGFDPSWATDTLCTVVKNVATIHTVWTGGDTTFFNETELSWEKPWRMSNCSGGQTQILPFDASGLDLSQLQATEAVASSFVLEFLSADHTAVHDVIILFKEGDDDGKAEYLNISY